MVKVCKLEMRFRLMRNLKSNKKCHEIKSIQFGMQKFSIDFCLHQREDDEIGEWQRYYAENGEKSGDFSWILIGSPQFLVGKFLQRGPSRKS